MDRDSILGIVIFLSIIAIALFGGSNNVGRNGFLTQRNERTQEEIDEAKRRDIQNQLQKVEKKTETLSKQVTKEVENRNASVYKGIIEFSVYESTNVNKEYIRIRVGKTSKPINITGWTIKSSISNVSVTIPKATYLFFTGTTNSEEDVYVNSGDTVYIATGYSPNGASFKLNKCSGYLEQFQDFNPNLKTSCPRPRDEDLSSIPKVVANKECLAYIDKMPSCKIQTKNTPANWNYECTNFIYTKVNYPSCISTHKNDVDFYENEWRIYLKRSERLWMEDEQIILLDSSGKIVDTENI